MKRTPEGLENVLIPKFIENPAINSNACLCQTGQRGMKWSTEKKESEKTKQNHTAQNLIPAASQSQQEVMVWSRARERTGVVTAD